MADARIKATDAFQATRNAAKAQAAYLDALGIAPGSVVETPGAIGRLFGSKPVGVTPPTPESSVEGAGPIGRPRVTPGGVNTVAVPRAPTTASRGTGQANGAATLQDARNAIANGAPRDAVIQRLKLLGVDPGGI